MNQIPLDDAVKIANSTLSIGRYDVAAAMCKNNISAHPGYERAIRLPRSGL